MENVKSVAEFINTILGRSTSNSVIVTYRGHGNVEYKLQPSIFRKPKTKEIEHILVRELIASHPEDFSGDASALEILVRMQHYSLPTRLLDVSTNPLVALYFACEVVKKKIPIVVDDKRKYRTVETDGHVLVLSVLKGRLRYFDSDKVSIVANLARLSWDLKRGLDTKLEPVKFNLSLPAKRLLHFVRQEKHGFLAEIVPSDLEGIFLVKPKQNNKRISAQSGAFFAFGMNEEIVEIADDGIKVEYITVSASSKTKIIAELDKLGINEKTLFPEIERAAKYITSNFSSADEIESII